MLPRMYREMALRTAHSVPMAGHIGRKKTMNRLLERFFRLGIYVDVQELCRTCPECQRVARHHKHKAPLISMPTISAEKPGRKMLSTGEGGGGGGGGVSGSHTLYPSQQGSLTEPTVIARITLYIRDSRQM